MNTAEGGITFRYEGELRYMDTVTLNHEQYLSFTGWTNGHCLKQTSSARKQRLEDMGAEVVNVDGKGRGELHYMHSLWVLSNVINRWNAV